MKLKHQMKNPDQTLDVREVLDALAVSAVFNPNACGVYQGASQAYAL